MKRLFNGFSKVKMQDVFCDNCEICDDCGALFVENEPRGFDKEPCKSCEIEISWEMYKRPTAYTKYPPEHSRERLKQAAKGNLKLFQIDNLGVKK